MLQAFEQAIPVIELAKPEGQIALDLQGFNAAVAAAAPGTPARAVLDPHAPRFDAHATRATMAAKLPALGVFTSSVRYPIATTTREPDMAVVEL
jgi:hypothetical protein